jgi:adenylosuccinate lyase
MKTNSINSISPLDGRYFSQTAFLAEFFSEKALIQYRLKIEIEYFIKLTESNIDELKSWKKSNNKVLRKIYNEFNKENAIEVKEIEKTTNHDVKAVEYFLKKEV